MTLKRDRARKAKKQLKFFMPFGRKCSNCGEAGPHFIPPSFGDSGFYSCNRRGEQQE